MSRVAGEGAILVGTAPGSGRVPEDLPRGVVAARAHDAAAGMSGGAAQVEAADGRAVVGVAGKGTPEEELVQRHRSLEDVAAGEAEAMLDVPRGQDVPGDDGTAEVRRVVVHDPKAPVRVRLFCLFE